MNIWDFLSVYGSLRWTGGVWRSEPVHLGESVRIYIIQSFIYREVHYFTEPSEGTVWFLYDMEVNQFLSYNRSLTHIFYAYLLWCNGSFSFIFYVNYPRKSVCRQRDVVYVSFFFNFLRQVCSIKFFTFWFEWHRIKLSKETINWIAFRYFLKTNVYPFQTNVYPFLGCKTLNTTDVYFVYSQTEKKKKS